MEVTWTEEEMVIVIPREELAGELAGDTVHWNWDKCVSSSDLQNVVSSYIFLQVKCLFASILTYCKVVPPKDQ